MTVSTSTNKIIGTGNGVTTSWPFSFKVLDPDHLVVTYADAAGDETTLDASDYIVALNADQDSNPGGSVSYSPAIASGTKLTILRSVPYTQAIDLKNQGGFFPEVLERGFDLVVMQVQQIKEQLARAFKLSPSQSAIGELEATDANRANSFLGFGPTGLPTLFSGLASQAVSLAMQPVVGAVSLAAARTAMGVGDGQVTNARLANVAGFSLKGQVVGSPAAAPVDLTLAQALAGLLSFSTPGHRLTLSTGVAVTSADVTGASAGTIFWTPHRNNLSPIFDGTAWVLASISEKSFVLDSTNFLSGKNHDVYLDYNAGTPRLLCSPAWSSDTVRADNISRDATYGWYVNTASITCRISNNGGTVSKAAGSLLYLGTFRCAANGQSEDSGVKRFVWNGYNRVPRFMRVLEATDTWLYNAATIRQANNSTANQLDFVRGLDEDVMEATALARWTNDTVGQAGFTLIGLDSTSVMVTGCLTVTSSVGSNNQVAFSQATWCGFPGLGRHFLAWLERSTGAGTQTWHGDVGAPTFVQSGIIGEVLA